MKRRIISLILSILTVAAILDLYAPVSAEEETGRYDSLFDCPFGDISGWYAQSAIYLFEHGYVTGTSDGVFSPSSKVTRAMAVQVICRIDGAETSDYSESSTFSDVPSGAWYHDAVEWAAANGLTSGTGGEKFSPLRTVTRAELAVMLFNNPPAECCTRLRVGDPAALERFPDADSVPLWAVEAVSWAIGQGLISGRGDGTIAPSAPATRGELAVILAGYQQKYGHDWTDALVLTERTCTQDGAVFYTCGRCGESVEVMLHGYHIHVPTYHREPTCTLEGETVYTCKYCGDEYVKYTDKIPHSYVISAYLYGDCESGAAYEMKCSACGATKQTVVTGKHDWDAGKTVRQPSCGSQGEKQFTCRICGAVKKEAIPALSHDWKKSYVIKYPTYNTAGSAMYKCSVCGSTKTEPIPAVGKTKGYDSNGDGKLTIDEYFGMYGHVEYLEEHKRDYLGTKYASLVKDHLTYWQLTRNIGEYGSEGRMNCTGFIATVFLHLDADLSSIPKGGGWYVNAGNWAYVVNKKGIYHYTFADIKSALNSGKLRKGDIFLFIPVQIPEDDYHFGFFWGDTPSHDWFWHSDIYGNRQSRIHAFTNHKCIWVFPMQGE